MASDGLGEWSRLRQPGEDVSEHGSDIHDVPGSNVVGRLDVLKRLAPDAYENYTSLRQRVLARSESEIPMRYRELMVVAVDVVQQNSAGAGVHARRAVRAGATLGEISELVSILLLTSGMILVQAAGVEALLAAEDELEKLAGRP